MNSESHMLILQHNKYTIHKPNQKVISKIHKYFGSSSTLRRTTDGLGVRLGEGLVRRVHSSGDGVVNFGDGGSGSNGEELERE